MNPLLQPLIDALEKLYASLPSLECRGKCANSCGPIDMSTVERERIAERGVTIPEYSEERAERWAAQEPLRCTALGVLGQCTVYDIRPMVCRLWGMSEAMPCSHGCRPSRYLTAAETMGFLTRSFEAGGSPNGYDDMTADMQEIFADPRVGPLMHAAVSGDPSAKASLMDAVVEWRQRRGLD